MKNKVIATVFLIIIFGTGISLHGLQVFSDSVDASLETLCSYRNISGNAEKGASTKEICDDMQDQNAELLEELPYKLLAVETNGRFLKSVGTRSFYERKYHVNVTEDGYCVNSYPETSTDYETEQMISLKQFLDEKGIRLLYVNEPVKYSEDTFYEEEFGKRTYLNKNADLFLQRISENGIDYLDLRECAEKEGKDMLSLFYRTDHHWTVPASKWAAEKIAGKLNRDYGYRIDMELYEDDRFTETLYEDAWCGEQGQLLSEGYMGLEDYTLLEPVYPTSYQFFDENGNAMGEAGFSDCIDKNIYKNEGNAYGPSWHFSYWGGKSNVHNNHAGYGKILVLGDSYEASMIPFLSLGIRDLHFLCLRDAEKSVREVVEEGDYDTVIVAYAQFMIGAHDDPANANYKMFDFK